MPRAWVICEGNIDAEAYVRILERHMLPSRGRLFPGTPCLFEQDNARPHSDFIGIDVHVPAIQIYLLLKMYGAS